MSEEDVIKRRLTFDGDGTGEDRRLNVLMKLVSKWVNNPDDTAEDTETCYDKIMVQLALIKHSRRRSDLVHKQNEKQLQNYINLHTDMEENIIFKKSEIATQKEALDRSKTIKQNRIHYDLLAKAITKEPPRTETNKKLRVLQADLARLANEKRLLERRLNYRKKHFNVLSTSANSLARLLYGGAREVRKVQKEVPQPVPSDTVSSE